MLAKIIAATLFALSLPTLSQEPATVEKPVVCAPTSPVLEKLVKTYQELPIWSASLAKSNVTLFVNHQTKTWTLLQWNTTLACLLDAGTGYELRWPEKIA